MAAAVCLSLCRRRRRLHCGGGGGGDGGGGGGGGGGCGGGGVDTSFELQTPEKDIYRTSNVAFSASLG